MLVEVYQVSVKEILGRLVGELAKPLGVFFGRYQDEVDEASGEPTIGGDRLMVLQQKAKGGS